MFLLRLRNMSGRGFFVMMFIPLTLIVLFMSWRDIVSADTYIYISTYLPPSTDFVLCAEILYVPM